MQKHIDPLMRTYLLRDSGALSRFLMKKLLSATLALLLLLSAMACITVSPVSAAKVPTAEDMGGYENLCLTYTFRYSGSYKNEEGFR
jgi:hypothetical protein